MERVVSESEREEDSDRIILGLLNSVEQDGARSQRHFAAELGIALGLVNAYLNRCIKKGLVKASQAPARRYAYYLTPQGFAEKSRLTVEYLSSSFGFFRKAKADCSRALETAKERQLKRLVLLGASDLAEIATICAIDTGIVLVCIVAPSNAPDRFVGLPVVGDLDAVEGQVDGALVTALFSTPEVDVLIDSARKKFGADAVIIPELVDLRPRKAKERVS
ncbi:DNA-binding MarR family transcriptional regulator [Afipia massiliensis]|uniref:DNA-binding MarR family transcriptional regulator n=1 Tax=Afipia massiliensis TaxID=211460 RepID=A0A840N8R9_9BRAD|nr:winged helix-turn-helix transcriptional regulator [Afipia massiliensis]MBB5054208.1 DNA-binding MarR family transcriptional regulator [Afipia massiliensis]